MAIMLRYVLSCALLFTGMAFVPAFAFATPQGEVRGAVSKGDVRPLREIERAVLPQMQGKQYIGPEYDPDTKMYRLKFINDGRVEYVDVDARTSRIIRKSH